VLSRLCRRLYTIERYKPLAEEAEARLHRLRYSNVVFRIADGTKGWKEQAPFDRIIVTAASRDVPQALVDQLAPGGILVMPIGPDPLNQNIERIIKSQDGLKREKILAVRFVPLVPGALPTAKEY
jgi:protein-L-isoaspartate(D-aspartate) O-methyltransferase